jgi:c-di-GMP-binding flagellar brake protein YcgR
MDARASRPERDDRVLSEHAILDRAERIRLLRALLEDGELVALHAPVPEHGPVASRVLAVNAGLDAIELAFVTDEARRTAFRAAARATVVALPGNVKLQFELERPSIVGNADAPMLRAPLPTALHRIQRRDAFRIEPPAQARPSLRLEAGGPGSGRVLAVLDLSAIGIALAWPGDLPAPSAGLRLSECLLSLPAAPPIRCGVVVRTVGRIETPQGWALRAGCELEGLEPSAARAVQVYVNDVQTRARRARPRLA